MRRFSKPLGSLFDFKQDFFHENDKKLLEFARLAEIYRAQPRREACENCAKAILFDAESVFASAFDVEYAFCPHCSHLNGAFEDTDAFCSALYADAGGQQYATTYLAADQDEYRRRVEEIYLPKAKFLKDALRHAGEEPGRLVDFGAGAGHFVAAAAACGFTDVIGYEPSPTLVEFGNAMLGGAERLVAHELQDLVAVIESATAPVASLVFVLEHVQSPRAVLRALSQNRRIEFVYFSVPIFSPTVLIEAVFPHVMPRHLVAGHTHMYTEASIRHFCEEFGFTRVAEWWFGLDVADLYRSIWVSLNKSQTPTAPLQRYLREQFLPLVDRLQGVLDEARQCTEVHMLLARNPRR